MRSTLRMLVFIGLCCSLTEDGLAETASVDSPVATLLAEGEGLLADGKFDEAISYFRKAEKASEGPCADCLAGLAQALNKRGAGKDAADCARQGLALEPEPRLEAKLQNQLGIALFSTGEDADLEEAAAAFERAIALTAGKEPLPFYNLGYVRLKQERDAEGVASLTTYLEMVPEGPSSEHARSLIDEPRRAREPLVPDFSAVTLDGAYLTADDLRGKVVLIDFWATWCGPCRAALPQLRRLSRKSEKKPFVLLSISVDRDEQALRRFIEENRMSWPQVWDQNGELQRDVFKVSSFPTYILVDHEGLVQMRHSGWSRNIELHIGAAVGRVVKKARKVTKDDGARHRNPR